MLNSHVLQGVFYGPAPFILKSPKMTPIHPRCILSLSLYRPKQLPCLTRVLSELVHGLEIDDVRRQTTVHLAEDHAPSAGVAAPDGRLYLVGHHRAVRPPTAVFVQPFPHHHGRGQEHVVTVGPGEEINERLRKHTFLISGS